MVQTIKFGKIDYYGRGRKINAVDITVDLREVKEGPELAICGRIWNAHHTDTLVSGQCLDTIAKTPVGKNPTFKKAYRLWNLYHLNSMHAGTPKQEAEVKKFLTESKARYDYTEVCKHLESVGLLEDNGYTYGHGWLYEAIPAEDLKLIKELIESPQKA